MSNILIVDDEQAILGVLESFLSEEGHTTFTAMTGGEGLTEYFRHKPDIVILDIRLPDLNGLEVLRRIQQTEHPAKVIMMTAFQDMDTAVEAVKHGAYEYIRKPLTVAQIQQAIQRALQVQQMEQAAGLPQEPEEQAAGEFLIGKSQAMLEIFKMIGVLCQNRAPVLIHGETGTGKELIARMIHHKSPYAAQPFITLDCSAAVETLIESELFGHEKGAFTGANRTVKGKIELAGSGTLFLDEIGELSVNIQSKFLGFLQRREYMRVGGQQTLKSDCRIIAATNRDLAAMVKQGRFREDLYYRLNVVAVRVPPLRERRSDIPLLVRYFLHKSHRELGTPVMTLQEGVLERIIAHPWQGNVRELENVLVEAAVRARGLAILESDMAQLLAPDQAPQAADATDTLEAVEKAHIAKILRDAHWVRYKAAERLGISVPTLRKKIEKYSLVVPEEE